MDKDMESPAYAGKTGSARNDTDRDYPAARERNVGEELNDAIGRLERQLNRLRDLRNSLPLSYLDSPASRFPNVTFDDE